MVYSGMTRPRLILLLTTKPHGIWLTSSRHMAQSSLGEAAAAATLINPFAPDELDSFQARSSVTDYPLLFTHVYHPTMSQPSIHEAMTEETVEEFRTNLDVFTHGALYLPSVHTILSLDPGYQLGLQIYTVCLMTLT